MIIFLEDINLFGIIELKVNVLFIVNFVLVVYFNYIY